MLAREAVLNMLLPRSGAAALTVVAILLGLAGPLWAWQETVSLRDQLSRMDSRGRNVLVFSALNAESPVFIGRRSCEGLLHDPIVERAGLVIADGSRPFAQLGDSVPVVGASSSLFRDLTSVDAIVGSALPWSSSSRLISTGDGPALLAREGSPQPDGIRTNASIVVPLSASVDKGPVCIVVVDPFSLPRSVVENLAAQLDTTGGRVVGRPVQEAPLDPVSAFVARPTRPLPLMTAVVGSLLATLTFWSRSSELAAYRLSGTSRRSLLVLLVLQHAVLAGCFATAATVTAALVHSRLLSPLEIVAWSLSGSAVWVIAGSIGVIRPVAQRPLVLAKDR